jgi:hypothetical protein
MTVSELIELLKQHPPELLVGFRQYSEQVLMRPEQIRLMELGAPHRPDGWIHDLRLDMPTQQYLIFPGN